MEENIAHHDDLISSTQILRLPEGIYSFTIQGTPAAEPRGDLVLPALQVGLAPARSPAKVEFLSAASILDRWLAYESDMIIVRITRGEASLFLTSVRLPDSPELAVEVKRLTAEPGSRTARPETGEPLNPVSVRILTHIKNVGDLQFEDCWAGWIGQKLPIEAFAVLSAGYLPIESIEYCGVTADQTQTLWFASPTLCGSRGLGMPMLGFAIRLKPALAARFSCSYSGRFVSGTIVGPLADGELCCSTSPADPLEGIDLCVAERRVQEPVALVSA